MLPILTSSSAVAYIDIKNEPDLDFDAHGRGHMLAWLRTMIHLVRKEAPELSLTIGWSKSDVALEMADLLDVVTYHDYQDVETAESRLDAIFAATDRQVMVTEIGVSSYEIGMGLPGSLRAQREALENRLSAITTTSATSALSASPLAKCRPYSFKLWVPGGKAETRAILRGRDIIISTNNVPGISLCARPLTRAEYTLDSTRLFRPALYTKG